MDSKKDVGEETSTNSSIQQQTTPNENHISKTQSPNSFFNLLTLVVKKMQLNAPFPKDLDYEQLISYFPDGFMDGFEVKDNEGVFCKNVDIVKKQSGILSEMVKQVAKGLFKVGIIGVSLPIRIFEPRSMLERYTDWWSFAPILLKKASVIGNKIEAFKYVICFTLSALFRSAGQLKPFNPMLGETYQASFEDGSKVYLEHSSHIPCVTNFLVVDAENLYKLYGYCDMTLDGVLKMPFTNSVALVQKGKTNVYLSSTNQTIVYQLPRVILGGMILGARYVVIDGHMKFEDRKNNLKAVICFNKSHANLKHRRVHDFYGELFYHEFPQSKKKEVWYEEKLPKHSFPDKKLLLSEIKGSWLENIIFDNKIYWSIWDSISPQIKPEKIVIPSDSRYREDRKWLKFAKDNVEYSKLYEEYAQSWKLAVEAQQRYDRTLREKHKK